MAAARPEAPSAPPVRASESVTDPPTRLHPCLDRLRPPIHDGGPGLLPYRGGGFGGRQGPGRPPAASWLVVPDSSRRDDPRRSARDDAAEAMHPTMPGATMAANSQRRSSRSMMTINACAAMGATSVIIGRADDPRARRSRLGRHLPRPRRPRPELFKEPSSMPSVWNGVAGMRKLGGTMWSKATELSTFRRVVAGGWNTPTGHDEACGLPHHSAITGWPACPRRPACGCPKRAL